MVIKANIPSYLNFRGHRALILYEGQKKTCARCHEEGHIRKNCPRNDFGRRFADVAARSPSAPADDEEITADIAQQLSTMEEEPSEPVPPNPKRPPSPADIIPELNPEGTKKQKSADDAPKVPYSTPIELPPLPQRVPAPDHAERHVFASVRVIESPDQQSDDEGDPKPPKEEPTDTSGAEPTSEHVEDYAVEHEGETIEDPFTPDEAITISFVTSTSPSTSPISLSPHSSLSDLSHVSERDPIPSLTLNMAEPGDRQATTSPSRSPSRGAVPPSGSLSGSDGEPERGVREGGSSQEQPTGGHGRRSRSHSGSSRRKRTNKQKKNDVHSQQSSPLT
ncbi:proteoglycan 4-like [Ischnura elegans]|uniref:proteoglycan 4-like n=1 Tax=Ischnura elegans TaxID=197161 RepID=UPI001ED8A515|nr:proteoglycan 4-like [Ischnura elegans]